MRADVIPTFIWQSCLSLTTGARQAEIMTLRWGQIDFDRQVITLARDEERRAPCSSARGRSLHPVASTLKGAKLEGRPDIPADGAGEESRRILTFAHPGKARVKAAGLTDFHWHDLRHTAASYLAMSGVSLVEIAKVLGHRTLAMVARYSHLSDGHIVATGEKLAARLGIGK